jgi:alpha-maltose-1-phosphate synthase
MADFDAVERVGNLTVRYVRCWNPLDGVRRLLPLNVHAQLYGSRIPKMIRDGSFDVVHLHGVLPPFAALRIAGACNDRGIPYVITSHGFNEVSRWAEIKGYSGVRRTLVDRLITRPFGRLARGAAAIYALSDREGSELAGLGVAPDRVRVVPNGVGEFFLEDPSGEELAEVQGRFGLDTTPMLFYIGSTSVIYKGLNVFLRAMRDVRQPFQAVVAGQLRSDEERAALLRAAGIEEGAANVIFTGSVSDRELRALYHLGDLFVYPTQADTLPLVILEAMSCGLPIVSTTVSGIPFMVGSDQGILVPPGDAGAVARAVNVLLGDAARRRAMSESGKALVRRRFRWARIAEAAVEGYRAVLDRRGGDREAGVACD